MPTVTVPGAGQASYYAALATKLARLIADHGCPDAQDEAITILADALATLSAGPLDAEANGTAGGM